MTAHDRTPAPPLDERDLARIEQLVDAARAAVREVVRGNVLAPTEAMILTIGGVPALIESLRAAWRENARYRDAVEFTVARVDNIVAHHCGRDAGERFCEEYGCSSLVELVAPLRTALAAPGAGDEATEETPNG